MSAAGDAATQPCANVTTGFVELFGLGLCRGVYSSALTREWHAWDAHHGSENDPVDHFGDDQLYMVYVTADGGVDLEHLELRSYEEAVSILLQVAGLTESACTIPGNLHASVPAVCVWLYPWLSVP